MASGISASKSISILFVLIVCIGVDHAYVNDGDKTASFECKNGQYLNRITSEHDNATEDRLWDFACTGSGAVTRCMWSSYENEYGQPLAFLCPGDAVVTGVISDHDNKNQDRRFKFKCCTINGRFPRYCYVVPWTSYWEEYMTFIAPHNYIIRGAFSYHDDVTEDRRWRFVVCSI